MTYDRPVEEDEDGSMPSSILFNNDMLRWQPHQQHTNVMDYHHHHNQPTGTNHQQVPTASLGMDMAPLQAVVSSNTPNNASTATATTQNTALNNSTATTASTATTTPLPAINTTNPALAPPPPILDPTKQYHPEWGVIKDQDFHPLTLKHQRDLENLYQTGSAIADFYFWQANLGGYCMADMVQGKY